MTEMLREYLKAHECGSCLKLCRDYNVGMSLKKCKKGGKDKPMFSVGMKTHRECSLLRCLLFFGALMLAGYCMCKLWCGMIRYCAKRCERKKLVQKYKQKIKKLKNRRRCD